MERTGKGAKRREKLKVEGLEPREKTKSRRMKPVLISRPESSRLSWPERLGQTTTLDFGIHCSLVKG